MVNSDRYLLKHNILKFPWLWPSKIQMSFSFLNTKKSWRIKLIKSKISSAQHFTRFVSLLFVLSCRLHKILLFHLRCLLLRLFFRSIVIFAHFAEFFVRFTVRFALVFTLAFTLAMTVLFAGLLGFNFPFRLWFLVFLIFVGILIFPAWQNTMQFFVGRFANPIRSHGRFNGVDSWNCIHWGIAWLEIFLCGHFDVRSFFIAFWMGFSVYTAFFGERFRFRHPEVALRWSVHLLVSAPESNRFFRFLRMDTGRDIFP